MMRRRIQFFFILLSFLILPGSSFAVNVEQFRPNFDNLGLINLLQSRALKKHAWSLGLGVSYAQNPIEIGRVGTGQRIDSLVDYQINMTLNAAFGITDWASVGLFVPFFPNMKIEPLGTSAGRSTASFGDIGIAGKFAFWNHRNSNETVLQGVAVSPYVTFPSGDTAKFTGDSNLTGGLKAVYDIDFWKNKVVANLGVRFREKEDILNLSIGQELLYGVGYARPIYEPWDFHVLAELDGSTTFNGFGSKSNQSPLEILGGFRKGFLDKKLQATAGAGLGITNGYGSPDFRIFTMITYAGNPIKFQRRPRTIEKTVTIHKYAKIEGGQIVILQPIHFETAKWNILPESLPIVQDVADLMKNSPQVRKLLIEAHCDWRGSDAYNMDLSNKRAASVRGKLIEFGVESERLDSAGRGESQPIADNKTVEGMAKNRRVEFHIMEIQEIKQGEEVIEKKEKTIKH